MDKFSVEYALLCTQSALLDVIATGLRAVVINVYKENRLFYIHFYYDGETSEELIDLWECAITESSANFGPDHFLDNGVERLDYPKVIPCNGVFAYLRKEANFSNHISTINVKITSIAYALLSIQSALLGVVTQELRSVMAGFCKEKKVLSINFYYDGEVFKDLIDLWESVIVKVGLDLETGYSLDGKVERVDFPKKIHFLERYAYLRKEARY